jgi:hypothetical protein
MSSASVSSRGLCLVLARNAEYTKSPETKLWLAVLCKAVEDLYGNKKGERVSARLFMGSKEFRNICDYVGLNPDFVLDLINQEKAHEGRNTSKN